MVRMIRILPLLAIMLAGCMSVPAGVNVLVTDTPEDLCVQYANCYYAPTRTIVVVPGQSAKVLVHEGFHAHQHETVLEAGMTASLDLREWYATDEAHAYAAVVEAAGPPPADWLLSANNELEDFAEAGARCVAHDTLHELQYSIEPLRQDWMETHGFC